MPEAKLRHPVISRHAVERLIERVFPTMSILDAHEMLGRLAATAVRLESLTATGDEQWRTSIEECVLVVRCEDAGAPSVIVTVLSTEMPSIDAQTRLELRYGLIGRAKNESGLRFVVDRLLDARLKRLAELSDAKVRKDRETARQTEFLAIRRAKEERLAAEAKTKQNEPILKKRNHNAFMWLCRFFNHVTAILHIPEVREALRRTEEQAPGCIDEFGPKALLAVLRSTEEEHAKTVENREANMQKVIDRLKRERDEWMARALGRPDTLSKGAGDE